MAAPHVGALLCVAFAVSIAISGVFAQEPEAVEAAGSRRMLHDYLPGVCDSYLNSNHPTLSILMLLWGIFYTFWGLAIVCDDYFVASLEEISEQLNLSADVAGATFMAAGSSAPELFASMMGVFAVKNEVGIGTIVGSAVFNLCCIIGGTALFTPALLVIDWKPITRDSFFYLISIILMIWVMHDSKVSLFEAILLVACYGLYVFAMYKNGQIMDLMRRLAGEDPVSFLEGSKESKEEEQEEEDGDDSTLAKMLAGPLHSLLGATIPSCSKPYNKGVYRRTFVMSILWIGALSYFMVAWATKAGCLLGIHPAIMGVTVLAAGTSVPDAIASLLVAADGQGDMAVSNAIGSNVFDILLGLGLPWLLSHLVYHEEIRVDGQDLLPLSLILLATLASVYVSCLLCKFTLTKPLGGFFFAMYFAFVAYTLLHAFKKIPF